MFNFNPVPTFVAPVPLSVPGLVKPLDVSFTFRHKTKDALKVWLDNANKKPDHELLDEVIASWDIKADGEAVPYTLSNLATLLANYSPSHGEIFQAYIRELTQAKQKN